MRIIVAPRTAKDKRLPPWTREGRQPTKEELAGLHTQHEGPAYSDTGSPDWFAWAATQRRKVDL
ncbi:MAG: hypothetical protein ACRD3Y_04270 [Bryobacteraceae bacterium]